MKSGNCFFFVCHHLKYITGEKLLAAFKLAPINWISKGKFWMSCTRFIRFNHFLGLFKNRNPVSQQPASQPANRVCVCVCVERFVYRLIIINYKNNLSCKWRKVLSSSIDVETFVPFHVVTTILWSGCLHNGKFDFENFGFDCGGGLVGGACDCIHAGWLNVCVFCEKLIPMEYNELITTCRLLSGSILNNDLFEKRIQYSQVVVVLEIRMIFILILHHLV